MGGTQKCATHVRAQWKVCEPNCPTLYLLNEKLPGLSLRGQGFWQRAGRDFSVCQQLKVDCPGLPLICFHGQPSPNSCFIVAIPSHVFYIVPNHLHIFIKYFQQLYKIDIIITTLQKKKMQAMRLQLTYLKPLGQKAPELIYSVKP